MAMNIAYVVALWINAYTEMDTMDEVRKMGVELLVTTAKNHAHQEEMYPCLIWSIERYEPQRNT